MLTLVLNEEEIKTLVINGISHIIKSNGTIVLTQESYNKLCDILYPNKERK